MTKKDYNIKDVAVAHMINLCGLCEFVRNHEKEAFFQGEFKDFFLESMEDVVNFIGNEFKISTEDFDKIFGKIKDKLCSTDDSVEKYESFDENLICGLTNTNQ